MHPLVIGISLVLGLLTIPILADIIERARDRRHDTKWLIKYGIKVEAENHTGSNDAELEDKRRLVSRLMDW